MGLEKEIIKLNKEKGRAFSQITLEDDYIVPDTRPDVLKIIHTQGTLFFEDPKVSNQALWINGRMDFTVLYRSEDGNWKLESVTGSVPFQEKLMIDGLEEQDTINLKGHIEDLGTSIINSRKLAVRAVVDITAAAEVEVQEEIVSGLESASGYEQKIEERELLRLLYSRKDILRIRNELELPSAKPNIMDIIFRCVDLRSVEAEPKDGAIGVRGEARICILYRSEGEDAVSCYETSMPFQGTVESPATDPEDISWIETELASFEITPRDDYDGEQRVLGVELTFDIRAKVWREERIPVLEDVYSLAKVVIPKAEPASFDRLLVKNQAKLRLGEQFSIEKNEPKILQICCFSGEFIAERTSMMEDGLLVEGILKVHILYLANDEFLPVAHAESFLSVEQLVEIPEVSRNVHYEMKAGIEQLQVNLMDSSSYEIKAQLVLSVIAFAGVDFSRILSLEEKAQDMEELQNRPGLVGYVTKEGESLWDIAKSHHTTQKRIMETNQLTDTNIQPGQKLIIVKDIY